MKVLLDTHVFLWWVTNRDLLSQAARQIIGDGGNDLFFSAGSAWEIATKTRLGKLRLSDDLEGFIAGQLTHAKELCAVTNQWVNSYKRLVAGYEAPVYISWARRNRSVLIRVPTYRPGDELAARVELRSPDPACNPYLAFAAMLACGLEGMEKSYEFPDPVEGNIFKMTQEERDHHGIGSLPRNLGTAIEETENSEIIRRALGDHVFDCFIELKKKEWDDYQLQVTQY